jgi:hypothetical protein
MWRGYKRGINGRLVNSTGLEGSGFACQSNNVKIMISGKMKWVSRVRTQETKILHKILVVNITTKYETGKIIFITAGKCSPREWY